MREEVGKIKEITILGFRKRYVRLPQRVCPIAWILENQDDVAGCGFKITQEMKNELSGEAKSREVNITLPASYVEKLHVPADPSVEGDKEATITLRKAIFGWKVAGIKSEDLKRIIFARDKAKEEICFVRESEKAS